MEDTVIESVIYGGNGPGNSNAEEHIDGIAACDVAYWGVGVLVVDSGYFTCESIWKVF